MSEFSVLTVAQDIISKTTLEGRNLMALILVIQIINKKKKMLPFPFFKI